jgi:hypothetical protein
VAGVVRRKELSKRIGRGVDDIRLKGWRGSSQGRLTKTIATLGAIADDLMLELMSCREEEAGDKKGR